MTTVSIVIADEQELPQYAADAVEDAMMKTTIGMLRRAHALAVSGAMRWPKSFRPEVMVVASLRIS